MQCQLCVTQFILWSLPNSTKIATPVTAQSSDSPASYQKSVMHPTYDLCPSATRTDTAKKLHLEAEVCKHANQLYSAGAGLGLLDKKQLTPLRVQGEMACNANFNCVVQSTSHRQTVQPKLTSSYPHVHQHDAWRH